MRERSAMRWMVVFLLTAVAVALVWYFLTRTDPLAEAVDRALATRSGQAAVEELWALGPPVIPHLAKRAGERDSWFTKLHRFAWRKVPSQARGLLPAPRDKTSLRAPAMQAISELGPLAILGAAPEVIRGFTDPDQNIRWHALRAGEWLAPESPEAMAAFTRLLRATNQSPATMFNHTPSEYIWARTRGLAPDWAHWLTWPAHAHVAAIALRFMGSNAVSAIPSLIETLDRGVARPAKAGPFDEKSMAHNRAMAATALGAIGQNTPEVLAALSRAWNDPDPWVRYNAAEAVARLAPTMTNLPPQLLATLRDRDNRALSQKCLAIAQMGARAGEALPILAEFADTDRIRVWLDKPDDEVVGSRLGDVAVAAKMAICRIDPAQGRPFLPDIASKVGSWWEPVMFLRTVPHLTNEVIQAVEPLLNPTNRLNRQSIAAYIILGQNPAHADALATLKRNKTVGEIYERIVAGRLLFQTNGDTNGLWRMIEEALAPDSTFGQSATHLASTIGHAAKPAIPALKRALWHKDKFVRQQAYMVLRKLAP